MDQNPRNAQSKPQFGPKLGSGMPKKALKDASPTEHHSLIILDVESEVSERPLIDFTRPDAINKVAIELELRQSHMTTDDPLYSPVKQKLVASKVFQLEVKENIPEDGAKEQSRQRFKLKSLKSQLYDSLESLRSELDSESMFKLDSAVLMDRTDEIEKMLKIEISKGKHSAALEKACKLTKEYQSAKQKSKSPDRRSATTQYQPKRTYLTSANDHEGKSRHMGYSVGANNSSIRDSEQIKHFDILLERFKSNIEQSKLLASMTRVDCIYIIREFLKAKNTCSQKALAVHFPSLGEYAELIMRYCIHPQALCEKDIESANKTAYSVAFSKSIKNLPPNNK